MKYLILDKKQRVENSNDGNVASANLRLIEELNKKEEEEKLYFQELNRLESEHSRLKAQLDVLDQAENALTGLAEGAKNLIQAAIVVKNLNDNYNI